MTKKYKKVDLIPGDVESVRIAQLESENARLRKALREFLDCIDNLTTDEFSKGGERIPRENARQLLTELGEPIMYTHEEATL